jgi:hypothetical protein
MKNRVLGKKVKGITAEKRKTLSQVVIEEKLAPAHYSNQLNCCGWC